MTKHPFLDIPILGNLQVDLDFSMPQVHLQKEQLEKVSALGKQRFPKLTLGSNLSWDPLSRYPVILHIKGIRSFCCRIACLVA